MAIYHLNIRSISRGDGKSATAVAAYQSASRIKDERLGATFNYTSKEGVEHTEIVLPKSALEQGSTWALDRKALWNAVEAAEQRRSARVAREYVVALPHELPGPQRLELAREFSAYLANRHGVAVDLAIHQPDRGGDARNHHAHLLATTRELTPQGLGPKSVMELTNSVRRQRGVAYPWQEFRAIREQLATLTNEHLQRHGLEVRVSHLSLAAQGIDRKPGVHFGPAVIGMARRGFESEVQKRINRQLQEAEQRRLELSAAGRWLVPEPAPLTTADPPTRTALAATSPQPDSSAAVIGAEQGRVSLESQRQSAAARWLEYRKQRQAGLESQQSPSTVNSVERGQGLASEERGTQSRPRGGREGDLGL